MTSVEQRFHTALELSATGFSEWDAEANPDLYLSPNTYRMLGFEPDDFPVPSLAMVPKYVHPLDWSAIAPAVIKLNIGVTDQIRFDIRVRTKARQWRWISVTLKATHRRDVMPTRIIGTYADITDSKDGYERYKNLINNAPLGVVITLLEPTGRPPAIEYMNDAMAGFLDALKDGAPDRMRLRGDRLLEFVVKSDRETLAQKLRAVSDSDVDSFSCRWVGVQGRLVESELRLFVNEWEGRRATYLFVIDVTRINLDRAELEERNKELERFTVTVSHDLRTPVISLRGFLGYLTKEAKEKNSDQFRADLQRVLNASLVFESLLNDLLELSRVGRKDPPKDKVSLAREARRVRDDLLDSQISAMGGEVRISDDLPTVTAVRSRTLQLFQNLIQNAIKYMGPQTKPLIEVGLTHIQGGRAVFVRDNGMGIPAAHRERVFDLFTKLDPESEGTGIGLAIVKKIIEKHGGKIWIEGNEPTQENPNGQGCTFLFTFPGIGDI